MESFKGNGTVVFGCTLLYLHLISDLSTIVILQKKKKKQEALKPYVSSLLRVSLTYLVEVNQAIAWS